MKSKVKVFSMNNNNNAAADNDWGYDNSSLIIYAPVNYTFCFALRFTRFTHDQCLFISQCKQKKCTSILNYNQAYLWFEYCKHGYNYFCLGESSLNCWQEFFMILLSPISSIKSYGFYFHWEEIFAKSAILWKMWKLPPHKNFPIYSAVVIR